VSTLVLLLLSIMILLAGALLFTNGIEWLGVKLDLGQGAVGSLLAAVATALPETLIHRMAPAQLIDRRRIARPRRRSPRRFRATDQAPFRAAGDRALGHALARVRRLCRCGRVTFAALLAAVGQCWQTSAQTASAAQVQHEGCEAADAGDAAGRDSHGDPSSRTAGSLRCVNR
jgi:hypothetical protein